MVVKCAKLANVPPVVRSGGHSFEVVLNNCNQQYSFFEKLFLQALSSMSNSLVIDMAFCNKVVKVSSQPGSTTFGIATFESGMRLGKLYLDLYNAGGWSFNAGACPYVGVGGHLTCGGKGYNARMYGMAADQVTTQIKDYRHRMK